MVKDNLNEIQEKLTKLANNLQDIIAIEAVSEFQENFNRQAFFTDAWEKRKTEPERATLVKTGRLKRSINYIVQGNTIRFVSDADYANKHNLGLNVIEYVKAGHVKAHKRTINSKLVEVARHQRKAHSKKVKTIKRQFVGYHVQLEQTLRDNILLLIKNAMK